MRQLITNDVYRMSRILKKLELKKDTLAVDWKSENSDEQLGVSLLMLIIENAHMAQNEINEFFGDLYGMTGEEFGKLPIIKTIEVIEEFKSLDGISGFFKQAGRLMN